MSSSPPKLGLRARKRRATENAIELAAVELALDLGVEHVTVEAICERADVSRSTFFNYFAGRDYAIVGRAITVLQGDEAFAVLNTCPGDLPRGIFRLIFASIGHRNVHTDVARGRAKLAREQPAARRLSSISMVESGEALIEVATQWLLAHPEHSRLDSPVVEANLAASLAHAAVTTMLIEWATGEADIDADESSLDEAFAQLRTILGEAPPANSPAP